ncbi:TetR/AcrR family transcriptional regulator [Amycolatopsis anabasis]|uniref:TetR/AcrR family transcriptional regulator n=1 Tax=Amycolatopsis anabasis TaxID=1840409 RepID=UPI00131B0793|nr:TetR/AcrR family transcriptional regulator [Amycolatopsis anabasis]
MGQRTRRTQDERSAETQRKLLDATIDCLVEYGYSGMTTARVVARAGVTRGAQAHHFQTKADLVTAALRHLALIRADQALQEVTRVPLADDPLGALLELIWEIHNGPVFTATVELWLAARTDPELREQIAVVEPTATSSLIGFVNTFPVDRPIRQEILNYVYTVMDTVRGLLLGGFAFADPAQLDARWKRAKDELRSLAETRLAAHDLTLSQVIALLDTQPAK